MIRILCVGLPAGFCDRLSSQDETWSTEQARDPITAAFLAGVCEPDVALVSTLIHPERAELLARLLRDKWGTAIVAVQEQPDPRAEPWWDIRVPLRCDARLLGYDVCVLATRRRAAIGESV